MQVQGKCKHRRAITLESVEDRLAIVGNIPSYDLHRVHLLVEDCSTLLFLERIWRFTALTFSQEN